MSAFLPAALALELRVAPDEAVRRVGSSLTKEERASRCAFCKATPTFARVERLLQKALLVAQQLLCSSCVVLLDKNRALTLALAAGEKLTPRTAADALGLASRARLYRVASLADRVVVARTPVDRALFNSVGARRTDASARACAS